MQSYRRFLIFYGLRIKPTSIPQKDFSLLQKQIFFDNYCIDQYPLVVASPFGGNAFSIFVVCGECKSCDSHSPFEQHLNILTQNEFNDFSQKMKEAELWNKSEFRLWVVGN